MKVLLDTNIVMDALQERQPFDIEAKEILKRSQGNNDFSCLLTANGISDIFYLYSKARGMKSAKAALEFLLEAFRVVSVTHDDCKIALSLDIEDFEDALVVVCAQKGEADCVVTRDDEFLKADSPVRLISPKGFIDELNTSMR